MRLQTGRKLALLVAAGLTMGLVASPATADSTRTASAAGRLSGRVQDANGAAVAGAEVRLADAAAHTTAAQVTSDSAGGFSAAVAQGRYDVTVSDAGHSREGHLDGVAVGSDSRLAIVLVTARSTAAQVTFSGTVVDQAGAALDGVHVTLYSLANSYVSTDSAADGGFSLRVPAGRYSLLLSRGTYGSSGYYNISTGDFDLSADRRTTVTIPGVTVTVTVRNPAGGAVAGAVVEGQGGANNGTADVPVTVFPGASGNGLWFAKGTTNSSGRVTFAGLPTRALQLSVKPAGTSLAPVTVGGLTVDGNSSFSVVTPDAVALRGVLTDADGSVLADARVMLSNAGWPAAETRTAADGSYGLGVPPGSYELAVQFNRNTPSGDAFADMVNVSAPIDLSADRRQDLRIPGTVLRVHVTDPSGQPAAGMRPYFYDTTGRMVPVELFPGGAGWGWRATSRLTDASGNASLLAMPGATVPLNVLAPNGSSFAPPATAEIVMPSTGERSVDVALRATVALSGVVRAGNPKTGMSVSVMGIPGTTVNTAADGSYRAYSLPGRYSLNIGTACCQTAKPSGRPEMLWLGGMTLDLPADRTLDFDVPLASVNLTVYDAAGSPRPAGPGGYGTGGGALNVPLAPGMNATSGGFSSTIAASSATSNRVVVIPSVPWTVSLPYSPSAALPAGTANPSVNALGITVAGDSDVALVVTGTGGSDPTPPPTGPPPTPPTSTPATPGTGSTAGTPGVPAGPGRSGYWMVGSDGVVYPFGDAKSFGNAPSSSAVDLEPTPSGNGYWVVDDLGRVFPFGDAVAHGNVDRSRLAAGEKVTSLSATGDGGGYWVFTSRGRVLTFGNAAHLGDVSALTLAGPVLDSIATPSGRGYYMVASDGGIFAFGDAKFYGSMGGKKLNAPVESLVPDADGVGYWLVASDGGIFAFSADFKGSMGGTRLNKPVTGMVRAGTGYLMVGEDGGIFDFSGDPNSFKGSLGAKPPAKPITSVAVLLEGAV